LQWAIESTAEHTKQCCTLTHKQLLVLLVCSQGLCCWQAAIRDAQCILYMRQLHSSGWLHCCCCYVAGAV
jgi:hypothetical protein